MVTTELHISETVHQYSFETDVSAAWSWATVKLEKKPIHPNRLSRFSRVTALSCIVLVQSDVCGLVPCKHGTRDGDYCENWLAAKDQSSLCDQTFLRQIIGNHNYLVAAGKIWKNAPVVGGASMTFELIQMTCAKRIEAKLSRKLSTSRPNGNESCLNHCQRLQGSSTKWIRMQCGYCLSAGEISHNCKNVGEWYIDIIMMKQQLRCECWHGGFFVRGQQKK